MYQLDLDILYFFNQTLAAPWLDSAMIYLTNLGHWLPVYIFAMACIIWKFRWRGVWMVVGCIIVVGAADFITNRFIKEVIARPRPCADSASYVYKMLRFPDGPRGGFGFPSSHAVNNFAGIAFFIFLFSKNRKLLWLIIPAIIPGLTRVYLGLHYPSDILGGILIGSAFGWLGSLVYKKFERKFSS